MAKSKQAKVDENNLLNPSWYIKVLLSNTPDLVKRPTEGVEAHKQSGEKVRTFLNIVDFVADYLPAAETLDVIRHTAITPCTICTFRKNKDESKSSFVFKTKVNAHRLTSFRCKERHEALRDREI